MVSRNSANLYWDESNLFLDSFGNPQEDDNAVELVDCTSSFEGESEEYEEDVKRRKRIDMKQQNENILRRSLPMTMASRALET